MSPSRSVRADRWVRSSSSASTQTRRSGRSAPNADTLYTTSFFDVGKEPWVLSIPDMKGRYFLCPMLDGWTTVFQVPGKRTTGTGAQTLCHHWPRMEGHVACRGEGIQIADEHRVAARSYLQHRHARGLCRSSQVAGRVQAGAAQFIRQGLHAASGHRPIHQSI